MWNPPALSNPSHDLNEGQIVRLDDFVERPSQNAHQLEIESYAPQLLHAFRRWVLVARPPGDFLLAVLGDSLSMAVGRADHNSQRCIEYLVTYLWNDAPSRCWGDANMLIQWNENGGWVGMHGFDEAMELAESRGL